ncbi:hypothetical protein C7M71_013660 [Peterkaempfera bronchialis]|uniref:Uncharacterized protein n=1 Tax=Peterkaempfera bronchialis TaxID=2126346 RepID=A0A345SX74_9ACTN|nr:hypothetical protein C7M71_013660 [Peterkaempfera bronchialis]
MTFGTLLSSQGTDASIETLPGSSGRFPSSCSSLSDPLSASLTPAGGVLRVPSAFRRFPTLSDLSDRLPASSGLGRFCRPGFSALSTG